MNKSIKIFLIVLVAMVLLLPLASTDMWQQIFFNSPAAYVKIFEPRTLILLVVHSVPAAIICTALWSRNRYASFAIFLLILSIFRLIQVYTTNHILENNPLFQDKSTLISVIEDNYLEVFIGVTAPYTYAAAILITVCVWFYKKKTTES